MTAIGCYLPRGHVLRHSLQDGDIVPFNVQDTQNWTALTDQCLSPVLIVGKLLPLQEEKKKVIMQFTKI